MFACESYFRKKKHGFDQVQYYGKSDETQPVDETMLHLNKDEREEESIHHAIGCVKFNREKDSGE